MEDFAFSIRSRKDVPIRDPIRDEKEEIQAEVRNLIKSCLKVEDEAAEIKYGRPLL